MEATSSENDSEIAEAIKELLHFLQSSQRPDIKTITAMNILCNQRKVLFYLFYFFYKKKQKTFSFVLKKLLILCENITFLWKM